MAKKSRFFINDNIPINFSSISTISQQLINLSKVKRKIPFLVTYLNAYNLTLALKDADYAQLLNSFDFIYADGWGVILAARLFGIFLPGRLTAKDFFDQFCRLVVKEKKSLFFLGSKEETVKEMVNVLRKKFSQIRIKGWQNGYFLRKEEGLIIERINKLKPDFLIIGMGSPKQEEWLYKNLDKLNIKVGWCVGGLFDFLSGNKPSCPLWLGDLGFEWFFRLLTEPKRLWQRYLIGIPELFYRLIKLKIKKLFLRN